jgi:hypothetical protein
MDVANSLRKSIERLPIGRAHPRPRYGFFDGVPRTLEEIGDEFNLTRERHPPAARSWPCAAFLGERHPSFGIRESPPAIATSPSSTTPVCWASSRSATCCGECSTPSRRSDCDHRVNPARAAGVTVESSGGSLRVR